MKNRFLKTVLFTGYFFVLSFASAQNVSLNMLTLNSGVVPLAGNGTLQADINATQGTSGQTSAVGIGKINLQLSVPSTLLISTTQNNLPAGWTVRNNNGQVINICNSGTTIAVGSVASLLISVEGVSITSGSPSMAGQLSFRTSCTGPGSLNGDNSADNSTVAGFSVTGVVPIKLTNFNAAIVNCKPTLNWITEFETNSDKFEIERANVGSTNWATAGGVNAGGFSNSKLKYGFTDNAVTITSGKVLYRLKMIDKDGKYKYSPVLPVFINCKNAQVNTYPNPIRDGLLNVNIIAIDNKRTEAVLISAAGQVVLKMNLKNGINTVNVSNVANGVYLLKVNVVNSVSKVLIQNK